MTFGLFEDVAADLEAGIRTSRARRAWHSHERRVPFDLVPNH